MGLRALVTAIEFLSPSNKTPGKRGRELYLRKQREMLDSPAHLVEIDLLRGGVHSTAVPLERLERRLVRSTTTRRSTAPTGSRITLSTRSGSRNVCRRSGFRSCTMTRTYLWTLGHCSTASTIAAPIAAASATPRPSLSLRFVPTRPRGPRTSSRAWNRARATQGWRIVQWIEPSATADRAELIEEYASYKPVWIQYDGTSRPVAEELVAGGHPRGRHRARVPPRPNCAGTPPSLRGRLPAAPTILKTRPPVTPRPSMSTSKVRTQPKISPSSAGLRMTPQEFDALTRFDERYRDELVRGVLVVSPPPTTAERCPNDELGSFTPQTTRRVTRKGSISMTPCPSTKFGRATTAAGWTE